MSRCKIYEDLDDLSGAKTFAEFKEKLMPILFMLAYHTVNGEAALLEDRETWHEEYSGALSAEAGAARPAPREGGRRAPNDPPRPRHADRKTQQPRGHAAPAESDAIPASLRQIMSGSHPSFRE